MNLSQFFFKAGQETYDNPHRRMGQVAFYLLCDVRPDLSEKIRGTAKDPFFAEDADDDDWVAFCNWLEKNWNK